MTILRYLAILILPFWKHILAGLALAIVAFLANVSLLSLSSWFIAAMAVAGVQSVVMEYNVPATLVRALALARSVGRYSERLVNHDTTLKILASLRIWFYRSIEPLAPAGLAIYRSGDLLSRVGSDIDSLDNFYVRVFIPFSVAIASCAALLGFAQAYSREAALTIGCALLAAGLVVPLVIVRITQARGAAKPAALAAVRSRIIELCHGAAELLAWRRVDDGVRAIDASSRQLGAITYKLASWNAWGEATTAAIAQITLLITAVFAGLAVNKGAIAGPDIAMLTVFALACFEMIGPLQAGIQRTPEIAEAARRLFDIVGPNARSAIAVKSASAPAVECPRPASIMGIDPVTAMGLSFRSLRFRYLPTQNWIVDNLNLDVAPGQKLGISGPSGVGKTSIFNLLMRFWEPQEGTLQLYQSHTRLDLASLSPEDARCFFSYAPQVPFLFHSSIRENLSFVFSKAEQASNLDHAMLDALNVVQLGELVAELPDGLDSVVGESGRLLSGGEARRLGLARLILRNAGVYLLDEPTEGLDEKNALALLDALMSRLAGKTVILISHRPRDFAHMDKVVQLTDISATDL